MKKAPTPTNGAQILRFTGSPALAAVPPAPGKQTLQVGLGQHPWALSGLMLTPAQVVHVSLPQR